MNSIVALPILAAVPTTAPLFAEDYGADRELLELGAKLDRHYEEIFAADESDLPDTDSLHLSIAGARAHTAAGWAAKAKTVVLANIQLWREPFIELDWDKKMIRKLCENIFAASGEVTVEQYLSGLGLVIEVRSRVSAKRRIPDAELIELGRQYEALLKLESPLKREKSRLYELSDRRRYERLGVDPDDAEACDRASKERWAEWVEFRGLAGKEVGYDQAYTRWCRASKATSRVGRKIMKLQARTAIGLNIKARVVETHDEVCKMEPDQQLLAEIRRFAGAADVHAS